MNELARPIDTEVLIITDGDNELEKAVDRRLDSIDYQRVRVVSFGDSPAESIDDRRWRISAIHNKIKHNVSTHTTHIFSVEDDTTYPPDTLARMIDTFERYEDCAFVEGVQMGRHKTKYIGGWKVDSLDNPFIVTSVLPGAGIEPIDAGGLYCALINANLYRSHNFEPYDKNGKVGLSCDFNLGMAIRKQGYGCYMDWSIICDHIGERGSVNLGNTKPVTVEFNKDSKGKWNARTIV